MTDLFRILVIVFLIMHGIGHVIWFLGAWTSIRVGMKDGPWILPGNVIIRSPLGRLWGLLALLALIYLEAAAVALLGQSASWRQMTYVGVIVSLVAVTPWLRQSPGSTPINAILADMALLFVLALPLSEELLGNA